MAFFPLNGIKNATNFFPLPNMYCDRTHEHGAKFSSRIRDRNSLQFLRYSSLFTQS